MSEQEHRHDLVTTIEGLQASPEAWAEMVRSLGIDCVVALLRTPLVLKVELEAAEERLRRKAA